MLAPGISRVHQEKFGVYGTLKIWLQLRRQGVPVAPGTVERLMKSRGLQGVRRRKRVRPNPLWVSDFTYVSTGPGMVFVAFVIDVFASCITGWCVSRPRMTDLELDALEQALPVCQRLKVLVHHIDRGGQYPPSTIGIGQIAACEHHQRLRENAHAAT